MSTSTLGSARPSPGTAAATALVAAATTWFSTLAWRGFTEDAGRFLVPLAALALLVAGSGALLRWWRAPAPLVVLVQAGLGGLAACAFISGSPLPLGAGFDELRRAFVDAQQSAITFAPPVPAEAPGVHPYLIVGGLACLLLVDVIACTLRRAPLAGLPLLAVYSVPVGMLGISLVWWVFAGTALGYLLLLALDQGDRRHRWGRLLDTGVGSGRRGTAGAATARLQAGAIGGGVTALAVVVPLLIPTLGVQLLDIGRGPGGDDDIEVVNPTTSLRRDLQREQDVPLLRVRTDDPDPSYLRIAVLNRFSRAEWSSGDRDIPTGQTAAGELPPLQGVSPTVGRTQYTYTFRATDSFRSTWLPTPSLTTEIQAPGDWRYDRATMDFIASDDDLTTSGLDWSLRAVELDLQASALAAAGSPTGQVSADYLDLPTGIDGYVRDLAEEVTADAPTPYEKAVALQNWFRESGGFTYDLSVDLETSGDDLVRFLSPEDGGRTGYCQQFASSMAVMARQLGIPARVAVGFLTPEPVGDGVYEFSSHDLHAWPELFFPGGGWVRFEPTPAARAPQVPGYTTESVVPANPDGLDAPAGVNPDEELPRDGQSAAPALPEQTQDVADGGSSGGTTWWPWLVGGLGVVLLGGVLVSPALVRRRRRDRCRRAGVEHAWSELRDTALDLGVAWPPSRSPRETGAALSAAVGAPDGLPALERLVTRLERSRYAPARGAETGVGEALAADLDEVLAALRDAVTPRARRRADLLPRSVFRRASARDVPAGTTDRAGTDDRTLEHV